MNHRLQKIIEKSGLTQQAFADIAGYSIGTINHLLSGARKLHEEHIFRISDAHHFPPWHFFADPEDIYPPEHRAIVDAYFHLDGISKAIVDREMFGTALDSKGAQDDVFLQPTKARAILHDDPGSDFSAQTPSKDRPGKPRS